MSYVLIVIFFFFWTIIYTKRETEPKNIQQDPTGYIKNLSSGKLKNIKRKYNNPKIYT